MLSESAVMWIYIQSSSKREAQFLSRGCVLLVLSHSHIQLDWGLLRRVLPVAPQLENITATVTMEIPDQAD